MYEMFPQTKAHKTSTPNEKKTLDMIQLGFE